MFDVAVQNAFTLASTNLMEYTTILNRLQEFRLGIEMFIQGTVIPIIIDKTKLRETLAAIKVNLANRYPRLHLLWNRPADIYNAYNFIFGRHST